MRFAFSMTGVRSPFLQRGLRLGEWLLIAALAASLLFAASAAAQRGARATAVRRADLQIGMGYSLATPDYTATTFKGLSGYATFDLQPSWGLDLTFHQVDSGLEDELYERSYELGPRYVLHHGRLHPYARAAYGRAVFNYPQSIANLAFNMLTAAAGLDVSVHRHANLRAEYEFQHWLGFHRTLQSDTSSMQPRVLTVGAAYHF